MEDFTNQQITEESSSEEIEVSLTDDSDDETKFALKIYCGNAECGRLLSDRGSSAYLLADIEIRLISFDLQPKVNLKGNAYQCETCECQLKKTFCQNCDSECGYHVIKACEGCLLTEEDNGHYWFCLFNLVAFEECTKNNRHKNSIF